jgi:hypothetical protein
MYPNPPGSVFNLRHYLDVHLPQAMDLLQRRFAITPERIEILADGQGLDGTAASSPYHCVCNLYFKTREDVDKLLELLGSEEAERVLVADWPNYTQASPVPQISLCQSLDPAELLAKAPGVIAAITGAQAKDNGYSEPTNSVHTAA